MDEVVDLLNEILDELRTMNEKLDDIRGNEYDDGSLEDIFDKLDENKFIVSTKEYYMELIRLLLDHLGEHKKTYYSIILSNRNSLVIDIILDTTIKDINKRLNISNIDRKSVPADVIINFYLGAVSMVGLNYLKSDNKYSKQDIINYLSVLIPNNI